MLIKFRTTSGSIYEIDTSKKRITGLSATLETKILSSFSDFYSGFTKQEKMVMVGEPVVLTDAQILKTAIVEEIF